MLPVSMVGRADELAELVRAWHRTVAAAGAGTAHTVVITGAAGIGKTLLVTSGLDRFAPAPRVVLSGTARVHAPAPYDWLAAVLSGRDTSRLPVPAEALAWLAQDPDAPSERYTPSALLRLAVQTVRALVSRGPAVLVVEDLHALDPASLNLIGELATAPDLPVLLVVTSQLPDAALSPQLAARTLARLAGAPAAVRQHLNPLTAAEVGAIVAQVYPGSRPAKRLARAVWERTGGNPYWLTELLAAAGRTGPDALAHLPLPRYLLLHHGGEDGARTSGARTSGARTSGARTAGAGTHGVGADLDLVAAGPQPADLPGLTSREIEVLGCLAEGMSNKQVARSLGISIRTVAVHVSSLLRKTRSASRTEAALWAVQRRPTVPNRQR